MVMSQCNYMREPKVLTEIQPSWIHLVLRSVTDYLNILLLIIAGIY